MTQMMLLGFRSWQL